MSRTNRQRARRAAAAGALLLGLALSAACGRTQAVATVPTETDANEIINLLYAHRLEARKELTGEEGHRQWQVLLDEGIFADHRLAAALEVLEEHGLPRPPDQGLEKAYEEGGMFPSESAQKAQRLKELKTELERQLRHLPGVSRVSANIVMPEESAINLNPYPATAAILIVYRDAPPAFTESYVRELVAKGVPKLKAEDVGILLVHEPRRTSSSSIAAASPAPVSRRDQLLLAIGGGLIAVFAALSTALSLQWRRRRRGALPSGPDATTTTTGQTARDPAERPVTESLSQEERPAHAFQTARATEGGE